MEPCVEFSIPSIGAVSSAFRVETLDFRIQRDNFLSTGNRQVREVILMNRELVRFLLEETHSDGYHYYHGAHPSWGVQIDLPGRAEDGIMGSDIKNIIERIRKWARAFEAKVWLDGHSG